MLGGHLRRKKIKEEKRPPLFLVFFFYLAYTVKYSNNFSLLFMGAWCIHIIARTGVSVIHTYSIINSTGLETSLHRCGAHNESFQRLIVRIGPSKKRYQLIGWMYQKEEEEGILFFTSSKGGRQTI